MQCTESLNNPVQYRVEKKNIWYFALFTSLPSLSLIASEKVLYRRSEQNNDKVILLSGGGSGHGLAHAGYLGEGALDVVIVGEIFASPSASQILTGLQAVKPTKGSGQFAYWLAWSAGTVFCHKIAGAKAAQGLPQLSRRYHVKNRFANGRCCCESRSMQRPWSCELKGLPYD
ncbi:hypothetical protein HZ326_24699 [Fusarium oxysporum f. sp. albedinis]|nr:hypothetical protein HZ326_24699 [Fusarium oxysporum f. sp. albedinis]